MKDFFNGLSGIAKALFAGGFVIAILLVISLSSCMGGFSTNKHDSKATQYKTGASVDMNTDDNKTELELAKMKHMQEMARIEKGNQEARDQGDIEIKLKTLDQEVDLRAIKAAETIKASQARARSAERVRRERRRKEQQELDILNSI